jgi:uncharacterized membrane protein
MRDLIAVVYPDEYRAAEVLATMQRLPVARLLPLSEVVYVTKGPDARITLHHITDLNTLVTDPSISDPAPEAVSSVFWGPLMALLFLAPIADRVVGTGPSGGVERVELIAWGISVAFTDDLGSHMAQPSSALFTVVDRELVERVVIEVRQLGGTVLRTALSAEANARYRPLPGQDQGAPRHA